MISEIYEAFIEAGVSKDKSKEAAEAITKYDDKFASLEKKITKMQGQIDLLRWMIGFNLAVSCAVLIKLLI